MTLKQFQPGVFEPTEQMDLIPAMEDDYERINRSQEKYFDQLRANDKRRTELAGKNLEALASLSGKFNSYLKEKYKQQKEDEEATISWNALTNGVPEEYKESLRDEKKSLEDNAIKINKVADKHFEETGDIVSAEKMKGLSGYENLQEVVLYSQEYGSNYQVFKEQRKDKPYTINGKQVTYNTASNEPERRAIEAHIRFDFARGLNGINPVLLAEYVKPFIDAVDKQDKQTYDTSVINDIKADNISTTKRELPGIFNQEAEVGSKGLRDLVKRIQGQHGGMSGARKAIENYILDGIKNKKITGVFQVLDIIDHQFKRDDGALVDLTTWNEWSDLRVNIMKAFADVSEQPSAEETAAVEKFNEAKNRFEQEAMKEGGVSNAAINEMQLTLRTLNPEGTGSAKLTQIQNDLTKEAVILRAEKNKALELANQGRLTTQALRQFSYQTYTDGSLINIAQQQDQLYGNKQYQNYIKLIESTVTTELNVAPDRVDAAGFYLISILKQRYHEYLKTYQDPKQAFEMVLGEYNKEWLPKKNTWGSWDLKNLGVEEDQYKKSQQYSKDYVNIKNNLGLKALNQQNTVFTQEELEDMDKSYPDGWVKDGIPIQVKLASAIFGVDAIDIINLQREAYGLSPLDKTDPLKAAEAIDPDVKKLICRYATADICNRGWGTTGKENTEIVPEEKKEELDEISKAYNISFAKAAAFSDLKQTNPLITDFLAIPEQNMNQFWKATYKYSGGTDKEALQNLIRPTLAKSYGTKANT